MSEPKKIANQKYTVPSKQIKNELTTSSRKLKSATTNLALFQRKYSEELDLKYKKSNELQAELKECKSDLNQAYEDLNTAREDLDDWYSKAEGNWFGNGGKELPSHSLFGQSIGDRESLKDDRDMAGSNIGIYKELRDTLNSQVQELRQNISSIKSDRQVMFDLKDQGKNHGYFKNLVLTSNAEVVEHQRNLDLLSKEHECFINSERHRLGINELEQEISAIKLKKQRFLNSFNSEKSIKRRKDQHRTEWFNNR